MSTLLLQIFLLLLLAFVAGAAVACLFRRLVYRPHEHERNASHPAPARPAQIPAHLAASAPASTTARPPASAADTARFERALAGDLAAPATAPAASQGPVVEVQRPAPSMPPAPVPAQEVSATTAHAPSPQVKPAPAAPTAAPVAAATAAVAAAQRVTTPPAAAPVAPAEPLSNDDLTRIRAIDASLQTRLNQLGIRRYQHIASWKASDVNRINQSLGFAGRIEQENWIEQAQILAGGGETNYTRNGSVAQMSPQPAPAIAQVAANDSPSAPVSSPASSAGPLPFGVSPSTGSRVSAAAAMAATTAAAIAKTPSPVPVAAEQPATPPENTALVTAAAVAASTAAALAKAPGHVAAPANQNTADRLHRILGINAEAEQLLAANGITRFAQIANWDPADIERFERLLGRPGRIAKENWIEQAKVLTKGTAVEADAPRPVRLGEAIREQSEKSGGDTSRAPRQDFANLRSVRSEALRPDVPGAGQGRAVGTLDDLKRIRGVGVLIEKKLNSLGVTGYDQVANWTGADIDRISQILDFKGRIERENWVEQARILSAGGQTEFSRRVDRGEVETSRPVK